VGQPLRLGDRRVVLCQCLVEKAETKQDNPQVRR
jgi:hypothetical protein